MDKKILNKNFYHFVLGFFGVIALSIIILVLSGIYISDDNPTDQNSQPKNNHQETQNNSIRGG